MSSNNNTTTLLIKGLTSSDSDVAGKAFHGIRREIDHCDLNSFIQSGGLPEIVKGLKKIQQQQSSSSNKKKSSNNNNNETIQADGLVILSQIVIVDLKKYPTFMNDLGCTEIVSKAMVSYPKNDDVTINGCKLLVAFAKAIQDDDDLKEMIQTFVPVALQPVLKAFFEKYPGGYVENEDDVTNNTNNAATAMGQVLWSLTNKVKGRKEIVNLNTAQMLAKLIANIDPIKAPLLRYQYTMVYLRLIQDAIIKQFGLDHLGVNAPTNESPFEMKEEKIEK